MDLQEHIIFLKMVTQIKFTYIFNLVDGVGLQHIKELFKIVIKDQKLNLGAPNLNYQLIN